MRKGKGATPGVSGSGSSTGHLTRAVLTETTPISLSLSQACESSTSSSLTGSLSQPRKRDAGPLTTPGPMDDNAGPGPSKVKKGDLLDDIQ